MGRKTAVIFQSFIDRLGGATDGDELSKAMTRFAAAHGMTRFAYLGFRRPGPQLPVHLTTYPTEWVYRYLGRRYQEIDPVVVQSRASMLPFFWDDQLLGTGASREQRSFFGEASDFGIRCGFNVPIHDGQGSALVAFTSDRPSAEMRRDVEAHRDVLHLASIYFHVHARRKLEDALSLDLPHLSPREIACLQWVVRGKSTWDIGEILSISRRTVVFHLENAKRRLRAVSLPQAVAAALYHKLIEF
jgi:LuxR family transcriptional regulator, activator of conjugal transfer of Ti plasmids